MLEELNKNPTQNEGEERIQLAYKERFLDPNGQIVLEDMLYELFFLQPCETPEQQALCNYAKELLKKIYGVPMESGILRNWINKLAKRKTK